MPQRIEHLRPACVTCSHFASVVWCVYPAAMAWLQNVLPQLRNYLQVRHEVILVHIDPATNQLVLRRGLPQPVETYLTQRWGIQHQGEWFQSASLHCQCATPYHSPQDFAGFANMEGPPYILEPSNPLESLVTKLQQPNHPDIGFYEFIRATKVLRALEIEIRDLNQIFFQQYRNNRTGANRARLQKEVLRLYIKAYLPHNIVGGRDDYFVGPDLIVRRDGYRRRDDGKHHISQCERCQTLAPQTCPAAKNSLFRRN